MIVRRVLHHDGPMNETILQLALQAIDDSDARVVLGDAIEQSGWWNKHLDEMGWWWPSDGRDNRQARAVAAVLLFGEWKRARGNSHRPHPWPVVRRCVESGVSGLVVRMLRNSPDQIYSMPDDALELIADELEVERQVTADGLETNQSLRERCRAELLNAAQRNGL